MKTIVAVLAAACMMSSVASAASVVRFNEGAGDTAPSYTSSGITFSTLLGSDIEFDFLNRNIALKDSEDASPILVMFNGLVSGSVTVDVGDNGGDRDNVFLRLYDVSGQLLDEDTDTLGTGVTGSKTLITEGTDIAFAIVGGSDLDGLSSVLIDNFTFTGPIEPIPTPAPGGIVLFATGAIALAFRGRAYRFG